MLHVLRVFLIVVVLTMGVVIAPTPASAASITVGGACTLADAIVAANTDAVTGGCAAGSGDDVIVLETDATYTLTAIQNADSPYGDTGLPVVISNITIEGNGATIQRDLTPSVDAFRLLLHTDGTLTLRNLTLRNGLANNENNDLGYWGGCVLSTGPNLIVADSTFTNCTAIEGSAIATDRAEITGSTLFGNSALWGTIRLAVFTGRLHTLSATNTTITNNSGEGMSVSPASVSLNAVTIVNNSGGSIGSGHPDTTVDASNAIVIPAPVFEDDNGVLNDLGGNILSGDPLLGALGDNGGPTMTRLPLPGSPAFDAANADVCLGTDQRGIDRPQGQGCDIGAAEVVPTAPVLTLPTVEPVEATGPNGAEVTFSATALDYTGKPLSVLCNPASTSTFAITTTTVNCTATDALDLSTSGSFDVTVQDTIGPVMTFTTVKSPSGDPYEPGDWSNQTILTGVSVADTGSGFSHFMLFTTINGGITSFTGPHTNNPVEFGVSGQGMYVFTFTPTDKAGNDGEPQSVEVNIDRTSPVTTATMATSPGDVAVPDGGWSNQTVRITLSPTDSSVSSGFDHFDFADTVDGVPFTYSDVDSNPSNYVASLEGAHVFTYGATDVAGNEEATKTLTFTVDLTAPTITPPANISVNATSPGGAYVDFDAPATSDNLGTVTTSCDYTSGSFFPVGVTTVTCTATDQATNATQAMFTVTVIGAGAQLDELYVMVQDTPISGSASTAASVRRTLLAQVSLAQALEGFGADGMACLTLTRLELDIRGQVSRRRISAGDAQALWDKIDEVQVSLGCGGQSPS